MSEEKQKDKEEPTLEELQKELDAEIGKRVEKIMAEREKDEIPKAEDRGIQEGDQHNQDDEKPPEKFLAVSTKDWLLKVFYGETTRSEKRW